MNRGQKRWITIEVPSSKGILKFKKKIEPFAKLIGILMEEWDFQDVEKIKISHKSKRQVSVQRLRELERENDRLKRDQKKAIHEIKKLDDEAKTICTNLEKVSADIAEKVLSIKGKNKTTSLSDFIFCHDCGSLVKRKNITKHIKKVHDKTNHIKKVHDKTKHIKKVYDKRTFIE